VPLVSYSFGVGVLQRSVDQQHSLRRTFAEFGPATALYPNGSYPKLFRAISECRPIDGMFTCTHH
jgi:hypothetical protein